jgi:hypothetical protein
MAITSVLGRLLKTPTCFVPLDSLARRTEKSTPALAQSSRASHLGRFEQPEESFGS